MFFKSRGLRLLLAVLLVFAQQQAMLHLLGHSFEQIERKDTTAPQEQACAKCLALAHLDHALAGATPALALPDAKPAIAPTIVGGRVGFAVVFNYRSRAPPVFS